MKRILIFAQCLVCFLLAAAVANAQQSATPSAKVATPENSKNATVTNTPGNVKEPAKPAALPFQNTGQQPQTVAGVAVTTTPPQAVEVNADSQKGLTPKNADRPLHSTIETNKKAEPTPPPPAKVVRPSNG